MCACVSFRDFGYLMDIVRAAKGAQVEVKSEIEKGGGKLSE
jgi:hypothetical protein